MLQKFNIRYLFNSQIMYIKIRLIIINCRIIHELMKVLHKNRIKINSNLNKYLFKKIQI